MARITAAAVIVAGAVGAVGGGVATYLGNRALGESATRADARGIARVYQSEFLHIDARLRATLDTNRLIPPPDDPFQLSTEDMKTLATEMAGDDWFTVRDTEAALSHFDLMDDDSWRRAQAGQVVPLDKSLRNYVRENAESAERAVQALADVAGTPREGRP